MTSGLAQGNYLAPARLLIRMGIVRSPEYTAQGNALLFYVKELYNNSFLMIKLLYNNRVCRTDTGRKRKLYAINTETGGKGFMSGKLLECVPNYSEGRDMQKVEQIADCFRGKTGVRLLDYQTDKDHNRCVITAIGEPKALRDAVIESFGKAAELIDMTKHEGQHPRMGAVDVVPFIPCRNTTLQEADAIAKEVAEAVGEKFGIPCFLYESSATAPHRVNLASIRKGQFEGMAEKMKDQEMWKPDFGPDTIHPTAGVSAVGARMPLVAFNVNLDTSDLEIANQIARKVRHINGGYRCVKAIGVMLEERNIAQVSMNLTDYTKTAIYQAFEAVKMEARRYGVRAVGTEIVGLLPMQALIDCAEYYMQLENFDSAQVMENRLLEEE